MPLHHGGWLLMQLRAAYSYRPRNVPLLLLLPSLSSSSSSRACPAPASSLSQSRSSRRPMAPTYRPYAADAVVVSYGGGGGERKAARWAGLGLGLGSSASAWLAAGPDQAEMKRRGRVASYKAYAVEGKVKASIRRGIRWIKTKCSHIVHR